MINPKITPIQANDMDKIFKIIKFIFERPITSKEIGELIKVESRNVQYYANAIKRMGLANDFKYYNKKLLQLSKEGFKIFAKNVSTKLLKTYLIETNYVELEKKAIINSDFSKKTKNRRLQSLKSIQKWLNKCREE